MNRSTITLGLVWLALMLLLGATMAVTLAPFGSLRPILTTAIAFAKAALILWFFMELRREGGLTRVFAMGPIVWVAILLGLVSADLLTRS
jgi:cytochrome c oxidase subunit IV